MKANAKTLFGEAAKKSLRKSRRKFDCPIPLGEFLKKMLWLPYKLTLMEFNDALKITEQDDFAGALEICLKDLPDKFQNYVRYGEPSLPEDEREMLILKIFNDLNRQILRYEDYRNSRFKLSRLVYFKDKFGKEHAAEVMTKDFGIGGSQVYEFDESGFFHIGEKDSFAESTDGVNLDRVHSCEICEQLFWAKREGKKESKGCSPLHTNALKMRNVRKKNKESRINQSDEVKEKRRKLNERKKEQKDGKERRKKREERNGNL